MKGANQTATMSDVAREAGVALGTVSKVINGLPVGESYRLKVEAAVQKQSHQYHRTDHSQHHHAVFRPADPSCKCGAGKARL